MFLVLYCYGSAYNIICLLSVTHEKCSETALSRTGGVARLQINISLKINVKQGVAVNPR